MSENTIGIVYNLPASAGTLFSEASQDVLTQVEAIEDALSRLNYPSVRIPFTRDLAAFVQMVQTSRVNMIFNLCETVDEDAHLCGHPAAVFELLGIPFTGSPSTALMLTTDKLLTKRLLRATGISTPKHVVFNHADSVNPAELQFPVIIKPRFEDASVGITQESIVTDEKALKSRTADLSNRFGTLLIEEYIAGREFNISLFGHPSARLLPVAEIDFVDYPDSTYPILDYNAKWDKSSFEYQHTTRKFPGDLSLALQRKLEMAAHVCFRVLMLRDYGRIDLRMDDQKRFFILEVNANPCLSPDAGFAAAIEKSGLSYVQMVERFINFMKQRSASNVNTAAYSPGQN
ncbi:MAG: ATP-grasp domain-containing protein [Thermodesulfobacteriota bacterium]